jgi:ribulose-phosphate 3-epimerase
MNVELSASLMCADFSRLEDSVEQLKAGGVTRLHLDFADGHFVPSLLLGTEVLQLPAVTSGLRIESHLMVDAPQRYLDSFLARSDVVILHVESSGDLRAALESIRRAGKTPGLALRPETPAGAIRPFLTGIDLVLVLSVTPGFAGGQFIPEAVGKVRELRSIIASQRRDIDIEADGSINERTIPLLRDAGANIFVGGSSGLFVGDDLTVRARSLLEAAKRRLHTEGHR